jgi:hypothetical protein
VTVRSGDIGGYVDPHSSNFLFIPVTNKQTTEIDKPNSTITNIQSYNMLLPGADLGFQVRGGGEAHLKRIAPSGGRRENCWDISCEKSRFYAKKSYFFQLRREVRKLLGYFV